MGRASRFARLRSHALQDLAEFLLSSLTSEPSRSLQTRQMARRFLPQGRRHRSPGSRTRCTRTCRVLPADRHALSLLHQSPVPAADDQCMLEDLLAADPRGFVAPLPVAAAPLRRGQNVSLVDGRAAPCSPQMDGRRSENCRLSPRRQLTASCGCEGALRSQTAATAARTRRSATPCCGCASAFWRAVRRRHELAITPRLPPPPSGRTAATLGSSSARTCGGAT